jgi:Uma2 family endonuclease
METERHRRQMNVLIESLELAWSDRNDFYASGDMFFYFSPEQVKNNDFRGPDFFVVLDTVRRERKSWVVWQEGNRVPEVVIELISESTAVIDRGEKKTIYARKLRVPIYVIFDPHSGDLEAYILDGKTRLYRPLPINNLGRVDVEPLGLFLGIHPTQDGTVDAPLLRWFDRTGKVLPLKSEYARSEHQRAETEKQRADDLASRIAEYERRFGAV